MRIKAFVFLLITLVFAAVWAWQMHMQSPPTQELTPLPKPLLAPAPDFELQALNQPPVRLHSLQEPVLILNFWASWCTPCLVEMPSLLKKIAQLDGKAALIALSTDASEHDMKTAIMRHFPAGMEQPHVYWMWDKNKAVSVDLFQSVKTPESILINSNRLMTFKIVGATDWLSGEGARLVTETMAE